MHARHSLLDPLHKASLAGSLDTVDDEGYPLSGETGDRMLGVGFDVAVLRPIFDDVSPAKLPWQRIKEEEEDA